MSPEGNVGLNAQSTRRGPAKEWVRDASLTGTAHAKMSDAGRWAISLPRFGSSAMHDAYPPSYRGPGLLASLTRLWDRSAS